MSYDPDSGVTDVVDKLNCPHPIISVALPLRAPDHRAQFSVPACVQGWRRVGVEMYLCSSEARVIPLVDVSVR